MHQADSMGPVLGRRRSLGAERHHQAPRGQRPELKGSQEIVTFEIRMVLDDLLDAHARRQELQEVLDGVAQPSHRGLTVTDRRVGRDAVQP